MSSVMRPSGPLPPQTYWLRRLVLVTAVVLVVGALWWLLSGLGNSQQARSTVPDATTAPAGATAAPNSGQTRPGHDQPASATASQPGPHHQVRSGPGGSRHPARQQPTGVCAPADVGMQIEVADSRQSSPATARLSLTSLATAACTLPITPDSLVLRITSGSDVVWSSDDCPSSLPARQVVVRAHPATTYTFRWDGRRSVQGCAAPGAVARPGGYWVEAALVGADSHKAYFDIRS